MAENLRSRHAFGSEANVDAALQSGAIDAYDILFLKEGKIGWIDAAGNKVIIEDKKQVMMLEELPSEGEMDVLYVVNSTVYTWNGTEFVSLSSGGSGVDESTVDAKIAEANESILAQAKAYADEQIAEVNASEVIEF